MQIEERIKTAIEFLKDGGSFNVNNLRLGMIGNHDLFVTGWSESQSVENLTKLSALKELSEIKNSFKEMVQESRELENFIENKDIKYNLTFNYGMGSIGICSERTGHIEWLTELK